MSFKRALSITVAVSCLAPSVAAAQQVFQSRGVDPRVDYAALKQFGPWDDRNYALTRDDLAVLSSEELSLRQGIPAYYRVRLRREHPGLPVTGALQYPLSALNFFLIEEGGYRVDGSYYLGASRVGDTWVVHMDSPLAGEALPPLEGEARVTTPNGGAESAVAINPLDSDLVIAGTNGPGAVQRMHRSTDGGASWSEAAALPLGNACCDPAVVWSPDGAKAYTVTLGIPRAVWVYRTGDLGLTWDDLANEPGADPRREFEGTGLDDKPYLHVDTSPTSPHQGNLYLTWHSDGTLHFVRSLDQAHTWDPPVVTSSVPGLQGVGSDIATDRAGTVFHAWPAHISRTIRVATSIDGGVTFDDPVAIATTEASFGFPLPSMETREVHTVLNIDVDLTAGPFADAIYIAWTDSTGPTTGTPANNHGRIQVAASHDGGDSWIVTTPHSTSDADTVDRYHPWLKVASDGAVHIIFYDTRRDLPGRDQVDLFHAMSRDGGSTWSAASRITAEQSPNINDSFEFGDYNGLDILMANAIAVFTDNRHESGGSGNSVDVYAAGIDLGQLFFDGFESGDTSAWDTTVP